MFGIYDFFPENYHGIARFSHNDTIMDLQRTIIQALCQLNKNTPDFGDFAEQGIEIILEFGIADGIAFDFIDQEMLESHFRGRNQQIHPMLDFFCVTRYHLVEKGVQKPLKFDYYILRFAFREQEVELRVFHEKGTRRLPVEDLISFMLRYIDKDLTRRNLGSIEVLYFRAL